MNREFKFRVWDIEYQTFLKSENGLSVILSKNDDLYGCLPVSTCIGNPLKFVVQQYTGLKDHTGKEIYEGDILVDVNNPMGSVFYQVIFEDGWFIAQHTDSKGKKYIQDILYVDFVVVGNIFENPELIK